MVDFDELSINDLPTLLIAFAISSARIAAVVYASPFLSRKSSTGLIRTGVVIALAVPVWPGTVLALADLDDESLIFFSLMREIIIGFLLGFAVWLPVRSLEIAGILLDTQRGSTMAQDFNVFSGSSQATPTAILLEQIFSGFFFTVGGLLVFYQFVLTSYEIWPVFQSAPFLDLNFATLFVELIGSLLLTSIIFVMPISGFMFLADIAVAYLAKVAPTINALTFGMPAKSFIMIMMLMIYIYIAFPAVYDTFGEGLQSLQQEVGQ